MGNEAQAPPPTPKMPGWKAVLSYAIAGIFDLLKLIFTFLLFAGPFIAAQAAEMYAVSHGWPSWLAGFVFYITGGALVAVGVVQPEIAGMVEALGVLMAMVTGFAGGLFMAMWFWLFCRIPPWKKGSNTVTWMGIGWILSMIPFVDLLPTLSFSTWHIVAATRKTDREEKKKWEAEQAKQLEERRKAEQRQLAEMQGAQNLNNQYAALGFQNTERMNAELEEEARQEAEKATADEVPAKEGEYA